MMIKTMICLMLLATTCSSNQSQAGNQIKIEGKTEQQDFSQTGLVIDNGINRGVTYTDPEGILFNHRYIPISFTNDTTHTIRIDMAVAEEYYYEGPHGNEPFRILLLPPEWALDGVEITDSMTREINHYLEDTSVSFTLDPGEKYIMSIGTLYPNPPKSTGTLPRTLFTHDETSVFPQCEWYSKEDVNHSIQFELGLKLVYGENCMIIRCGHISFI